MSNGGAQRGHTVISGFNKHVFHHFGSGTLLYADTYIPEQFIVNPMIFCEEARELKWYLDKVKIWMNPGCKLTTPFDMIANHLIEESRGDQRHGSCGVGIWETILRDGITVGEMAAKSRNEMVQYLEWVRDDYFIKRINSKSVKIIDTWEAIIYSKNQIDNYINDFLSMLKICAVSSDYIMQSYDYIVFENGQGLLLDQNIEGFGKNTTPSNTGLKNAAEMINSVVFDNNVNVEVVYVSRTYMTRHGAGRFDTETNIDKLGNIRTDFTNLTNQFQGALRYGSLDYDELEKRVVADFNKYGNKDWKLSMFFTHDNEVRLIKSKVNHDYYVSNGITKASVKKDPVRDCLGI